MANKITGGFTAVPGFQAAGVAAGIKRHNGKDLALLVAPGSVPVAGVFTRNSFAAAPVQVTKKRVETGFARAIVANSGCANACTGLKGLEDVLKGSGAVEAVERPDQFSGDRLVEDIRRLLEDGRAS